MGVIPVHLALASDLNKTQDFLYSPKLKYRQFQANFASSSSLSTSIKTLTRQLCLH